MYLLMKKDGEWRFPEEEVDVGFGSLPGGSTGADETPGVGFPEGGIQFLLQIGGEGDSRLLVNSAYDQQTWLYGKELDYTPDPVIEEDPQAGVFEPWRLALNRPLVLPESKRKIPFEDYEVGVMKPGITDPADPDFDSPADWYAEGDVLEVRIPWTMVGYTHPSTTRVWDYPYEAGDLRVYPTVREPGQTSRKEVRPLLHLEGLGPADLPRTQKEGLLAVGREVRDPRPGSRAAAVTSVGRRDKVPRPRGARLILSR